MCKNASRCLLCALLCIGLLCSCSAVPEEQNGPTAQKTKRPEEPSPSPIEYQLIETTAEIPPGDPELSGRLWEGPVPEDFDFRNRLFIDGAGTCYLIDMDGKMVRWGDNWDNIDAGWEESDGLQPYRLRNILIEDAKKITIGYRTNLAIDCYENL